MPPKRPFQPLGNAKRRGGGGGPGAGPPGFVKKGSGPAKGGPGAPNRPFVKRLNNAGGGGAQKPNMNQSKNVKRAALRRFLEENKYTLDGVKARGENLVKLYKESKPLTWEQLGIGQFLTPSIKIEGTTVPARIDYGLIEVNASDEEARLLPVEPPVHELVKKPFAELDIVKNGAITAAKFQEATDFVASDKFGKETFTIELAGEVTEENQKLVRRILQARLGDTTLVTLTKDGEKNVIKVKKYAPPADKRDFADDWLWEQPYVRFVLLKNNKTTTRCVELAAKELGLPTSLFSYSRTNVTTTNVQQFICARFVEPTRVKKGFQARNEIGSFAFQADPIKSDAQGFIHTMVVRNLKTEEAKVNEVLQEFCDLGYVNYFPYSTLDLYKVPQHEIGAAILRSNFRKASKLILQPNNPGLPNHVASKSTKMKENYFIFKDAKKAVSMFKGKASEKENSEKQVGMIESHLLKCLGEAKALPETFETVPKHLLRPFLEAYQQYVWNCVVSRFIKERKTEVKVGDLVMLDESELVEPAEGEEKKLVKTLVQADIDSGRYSIHDIVLPLIAQKVKYPENDVATWYDEVLAKETIKKDALPEAFELRAGYRPAVALPQSLQWSFVAYKDDATPLIMKKLNDDTAPPPASECTKKALILEFYLPKDAQARVVLREIFKTNDCGKTPQLEQNVTKEHINDVEDLVNVASEMLRERKAVAMERRAGAMRPYFGGGPPGRGPMGMPGASPWGNNPPFGGGPGGQRGFGGGAGFNGPAFNRGGNFGPPRGNVGPWNEPFGNQGPRSMMDREPFGQGNFNRGGGNFDNFDRDRSGPGGNQWDGGRSFGNNDRGGWNDGPSRPSFGGRDDFDDLRANQRNGGGSFNDGPFANRGGGNNFNGNDSFGASNRGGSRWGGPSMDDDRDNGFSRAGGGGGGGFQGNDRFNDNVGSRGGGAFQQDSSFGRRGGASFADDDFAAPPQKRTRQLVEEDFIGDRGFDRGNFAQRQGFGAGSGRGNDWPTGGGGGGAGMGMGGGNRDFSPPPRPVQAQQQSRFDSFGNAGRFQSDSPPMARKAAGGGFGTSYARTPAINALAKDNFNRFGSSGGGGGGNQSGFGQKNFGGQGNRNFGGNNRRF